MTERRLIIVQPNGAYLYAEAHRALIRRQVTDSDKPVVVAASAATVDLSGIPNADATAPFTARIEELCDHGQWHQVGGEIILPNWDDNEWRNIK